MMTSTSMVRAKPGNRKLYPLLFYLYLLILGWGPTFQNIMGIMTLRIDEVLVIFLFTVGILLPAMIEKGQIPHPFPRLFACTWGIYLFLVAFALLGQAILVGVESLRPLWPLGRLLLLTVVFIISYSFARKYKEHIAATMDLFLVISLGIAVIGILQWFNVDKVNAFMEQYYPRITTHIPHAATAVFGGNPTIMGTFLTAAISFLFARLFGIRESAQTRATLKLTLGVLLFALFLTASKLAIFVGIVAPFFLWTLLRRKRIWDLILVAATWVGVLWLANMITSYVLIRIKVSLESSVWGRWETWNYLVEHLSANILTLMLGNGFQAEMPNAPDNAYIYELLLYGIIGLLGYVIFLFGNLFSILSLCMKTHDPYEKALYAGASGMLLSMAIVGIAYATVSAERLSEFLFVLLGITYGIHGSSPHAERQRAAGSDKRDKNTFGDPDLKEQSNGS
jgi:hypothetical protein